jgi:hypothetical protein
MKATRKLWEGKMQKMLAVSFFFMLMLSAGALYAQDPVIHQHWKFLGESEKLIDCDYSVIECPSEDPEIFVKLFNENPSDKTLDFTLTVSEGTNTPVEYEVTDYDLDAAAMIKPKCGSTDYADLRFAVPSGFDPKKLKVKITFPE